MPISKLDSTAALIVIDLQKGILSIPTVHPSTDIVARSARLAKAFREHGLPVFFVNVTGRAPGRTDAPPRNMQPHADWTDLSPDLGIQPSDHTISKQRWGAFIGTSLHADLQSLGVTQVVLTGIATTAGVESTARSAYDHGYNVAIVIDAITDRDADTHNYAVEKIFPRLAETGTTESVLKLLQEAPPR